MCMCTDALGMFVHSNNYVINNNNPNTSNQAFVNNYWSIHHVYQIELYAAEMYNEI